MPPKPNGKGKGGKGGASKTEKQALKEQLAIQKATRNHPLYVMSTKNIEMPQYDQQALYQNRRQQRNMLTELARQAPKAVKGSATYKVYKLFQTKDERLLANALGIVARHLDPYTYFNVHNMAIDAFIRTILARSRFCKGLSLLAPTGDDGDKYCFIKFNADNPLAPISLLKQLTSTYFGIIPAKKAGDGEAANYKNDATVMTASVAGTIGPTIPTLFSPVVHPGVMQGTTMGNLCALHPAAGKPDFHFFDASGNQIDLAPEKKLVGKYAGMLPVNAADVISAQGKSTYAANWNMNAIFKLSDGTFTYGTASLNLATTTISLGIVAPANAVAAFPFIWCDSTAGTAQQGIEELRWGGSTSSWSWEAQFTDYADDVYQQMLNYCENGYRFVITPENADAYKSGFTEIVRVPNRSHYVAARDPITYWDVIRQTQGLEQRAASMAGSGDDGEGVSGFIPSGTNNGNLYSRSDAPSPFETTIFAFRQPAAPGGLFQDTTMEIQIEYAYQYQPALYNQQNVARYYEYDPQAEAIAQSVLCKLKWFTCNPGHSIFEKAAGVLHNAKNKLVAYNASHPEVAPKIMEALTSIGMSLLA